MGINNEGRFANDAVLPEQFFRIRSIVAGLKGEASLMWAIMEQAVGELQSNWERPSGRAKHIVLETEMWLNSPDSDWLFSFESICQAFEISPEKLRIGIMRLKEKPHNARYYRRVRRHMKIIKDAA